jgi:hypothetical protein
MGSKRKHYDQQSHEVYDKDTDSKVAGPFRSKAVAEGKADRASKQFGKNQDKDLGVRGSNEEIPYPVHRRKPGPNN